MKSIYAAVLLVVFSACVPKDYCETEHPIMLVPGVSGFSTLVGFMDYWWQIPRNLRNSGAVVRCASISAVNGPDVRGEQLIDQVEEFLAETGKDRVHLIGHSHGSPTARYVAHVRPDLVASVSSIAGGNRPLPFPDDSLDVLTEYQKNLLFTAFSLFGEMINVLGGTDWAQDGQALIYSSMGKDILQFNTRYPHGLPKTDSDPEGDYYAYVPGDDGTRHFMRFYSWTGAAPGLTNPLDPFDPFAFVFGKLMDSYVTDEFEEKAGDLAHEHDGMIMVWSARFGKVIREDYYWNHTDGSNMMFGLTSPFASNPIAVFRQHINRLQADEMLPDLS